MTFAEDAVPNNASSAVITKGGRGLILEGLKITPTELYFGALVVGEDQLVRSFKVTNIGRKTLRINSVVLETESEQFSLTGAHPTLLKSEQTFSMEVKYESTEPGLVVGVIYITTNEQRDPYKVTLSGRVISSLYLEELYDEFKAELQQESWARATADEAEAGQRLLLKAELGDEIEAKVIQERIARVTMFEATASDIETLEARVTDNTAEINSEKIVRATADEAMASRLDLLEATTGDGLEEAEVRAWIQEEATVRSSADAAEAQAREILGATLNDAIIDVDALIVEERNARVTALLAEASARQQLQADLSSELEDVIATIGEESTVRATADTALAQRLTTLEAETDGIDHEARASIEEERLARIAGDEAEALARQTLESELETNISGVRTDVEALVVNESIARSTADQSLAQTLSTVQSTWGSNLATAQATLQTKIDTVDGKVTAINARYQVYLTAGNLIGGFQVVNTGATVGAWFDVDRFYIGRTTADGIYPFVVENGVVNIAVAAIGTARINYLQLAGGAVSVSNSANFSRADIGFWTTLAVINLSIPASGYVSFTGSISSSKRSDLNSASVKWHQFANVNVRIKKNGVEIYSTFFTTRYYNGAYIGNTADATLGGVSIGQVAMAGGLQVTASPGDVFTLDVAGGTSLINLSTSTTYSLGDITGFINFIGAYR